MFCPKKGYDWINWEESEYLRVGYVPILSWNGNIWKVWVEMFVIDYVDPSLTENYVIYMKDNNAKDFDGM